MERRTGKGIIRLVRGDITEMETRAIVNAANESLILGAGVAGAIRTKGGPSIQEECYAIGHTPVGRAALTRAGRLKADFVIHAVGPRWGEGDEQAKLNSAVKSSLELASARGLESIALPAISTGIFGFPVREAADISVRTAMDHLAGDTALQEIVFCLFDQGTYDVFKEALEKAAVKP